MNKKEIEAFLVKKQGYLKKSPIEVAKVLWKNSSKHTLPKNESELTKELQQIREIQTNLRKAKSKIAEDVNTELLDIYHTIIADKNKPKRRLFLDIETSPNVVYSWRIGRKIDIGYENLITERAIICVCYKWEGEKEVKSILWINNNDENVIRRFSKVIAEADEIVTHNGDSFDIKHLRARSIFHGISFPIKLNSIDTLKLARRGFNFNSNRLDYLGQFLGVGSKAETGGFNLWKEVLNGSNKALYKMEDYCKNDVELLQKVFNKLQEFVPEKKFRYDSK